MEQYKPTLEEIKYAISNARQILEQFFPHVSDQDVAKLRSAMRKRLEEYYKEQEKEESGK